MDRTRGRLIAVAVAAYVAWCGVQTWLGYRGVQGVAAFNRAEAARYSALSTQRVAHGLPPLTPLASTYFSLPASMWIRNGATSAAAMALVLVLGVALVIGGRRWWSLIVALIPAAVVAGRLDDGDTVGQGWGFTQTHFEGRMALGIVVDTFVVALIVALLVKALPRDAASVPASTALLRGVLPAIVLAGWWLIQNPVDSDDARKVWVAQAVVWVFAIALIASSSLPIVPRLFVVLFLAPYMSVGMLNDLIGAPGTSIDTTQFVHHMLVAAGTVAYVATVPWLLSRARHHRLAEPGDDGVLTPS